MLIEETSKTTQRMIFWVLRKDRIVWMPNVPAGSSWSARYDGSSRTAGVTPAAGTVEAAVVVVVDMGGVVALTAGEGDGDEGEGGDNASDTLAVVGAIAAVVAAFPLAADFLVVLVGTGSSDASSVDAAVAVDNLFAFFDAATALVRTDVANVRETRVPGLMIRPVFEE